MSVKLMWRLEHLEAASTPQGSVLAVIRRGICDDADVTAARQRANAEGKLLVIINKRTYPEAV